MMMSYMVDGRKHIFTGVDRIMVALFVAIVALLPFGRLAEVPILILSCWGLLRLLMQFSTVTASSWFKPFSLVYLSFLLLSSISSLDSLWPEKSWLVSLSSVRFYLVGVAILSQQNTSRIVQQIQQWLVVVLLIWVVDALLQAITGSNVLGFNTYPGRLTGIFDQNVKLGPVLALFMPLVLIQSYQYKQWLRWLSVLLVLVVILLSGTRSAWLMAIFVMVMFWWHHIKGRRFLLLAKVLMLAILGMTILYFVSNDFQQRIDRSAQIFHGDSQAIDFALADRLPIWQTAINMYEAHPINGVGVRAFRKAYETHAEPDDSWVAQHGTGLHAHHWVLELMAETGTIGLFLFALLMLIVFKNLRTKFQQNQVWPYGVALMAALLPVISLYSLFSSFWSICLWWLLIMMFVGAKDD